ncbi:hypothetical protein H0H93_006981 [Arthromyces matolae]|nr:hypothetical protein H0H93_006981 [Arthromyces matolae]
MASLGFQAYAEKNFSKLSIGLIPQSLKASTKYEVDNTLVSAEIRASLNQPLANGLKLAVSRQLFEERPEVASIEIDIRQNPRYTFRLQSLATFGMQKIDENTHLLPSTSGLKAVTGETSTGIRFQSIIPTLFVEQALNLTELALQLKLSFEYTFYVGLEWVCSGTWSPSPEKQKTHPSSSIVHENNVFSLPFKLASEPDSAIACCGVILPAMVALLSHHLVLKPRRRKQRLESIREARREMVESCGMRGGREAILKILKTTARKTTEAETSKEGLLIVEATWGPMYEGDDAKDLFVDVTVPLQVLVHRSQVFIPADRNKSDIRGFGDPAPFVCKVLCIRYLFRNRPHYAEIREDFPVVLPLSDHRVD